MRFGCLSIGVCVQGLSMVKATIMVCKNDTTWVWVCLRLESMEREVYGRGRDHGILRRAMRPAMGAYEE